MVKRRKTLIVVAHPLEDSFVVTCARAAEAARLKRGDEVKFLDLYRIGFNPTLHLEDWENKDEPSYAHELHAEHGELLKWADSLIVVYPTWFGGFPAMLKGWVDRTWHLGIAFNLKTPGPGITGNLRNIHEIVGISTHGSSKWTNALQGEPGKNLLLRGMRVLCHPLCRARWIAFYRNDTATAEQRREFLARIGRKLAK